MKGYALKRHKAVVFLCPFSVFPRNTEGVWHQ
ncbi:hypothetical protein ELI_1468 [Eubacterium callanderi]|uniref:Uncharacterized protein n=1 Tax=Eubacterium callanderi TaxID=53442 RepID=E3GLE0_9FIRM|nr:hypothetical protein ELI_1468 [Eubacterium callanderi]